MSKERVKKKLVINPEEAEIIKLIYDWYISGLGAKAITSKLNQEGYGYRGKKWSKNRILDIIGDEAYVGRYYFNKRDHKTYKPKPREEWVCIAVEPILDEVTFEKARILKEQRDPSRPQGNPAITGSKTLFTGLAICGLCGGGMTLETAKSGRFVYYNCTNFVRKGSTVCTGQRIPAKKLEEAILDHLANQLFTPDRIKTIIKGIHKEIKELDQRHDQQRKSLTRQLEVIKNKLTRQYEAIESGAIDLADIGGRIRELKSQRDDIEVRLAELKQMRTIPITLYSDNTIRSFQQTIKEMFLGEDRVMTKRYLKLLIERMVINLPRVEIIGKTETVLAILENQKAVRTGDGLVLTAVGSWLPGTDSNRRQGG